MSEIGGAGPNKVTIVVGVMTLLLGCVPFLALAGILPHGNEPTDPAPSWMGWTVGAVFVAAGLIVIMRGALGSAGDSSGSLPDTAPRALRVLHDALGVGIAGGLALMFSWTAFGPGPRHFTANIDGLVMQTSGSGDTIGRVAFGFGAVVIWCVTGAFALSTLRRWRQ